MVAMEESEREREIDRGCAFCPSHTHKGREIVDNEGTRWMMVATLFYMGLNGLYNTVEQHRPFR